MSHLVQVQELVPHGRPEHSVFIFGTDDETTKLAHPGQPGRLEHGVVGGKVLLHDSPLGLGKAVGGGEEVLGLPLILHLLEPRGKESREQGRDDQKVARIGANGIPQPVEEGLESVVDDIAAHGWTR